jgi:hypothetical protein
MFNARSLLALPFCIVTAVFAGVAPAHAGDKLEIISEGGIGRLWAAAPGSNFTAPGYPAEMKERRAQVCLNIAYTLAEEGVPSELELLRSWSRDGGNVPLSEGELDPFVQSAAAALSQWRFVPKDGGKRVRPTRSSATMIFRASNEVAPATVAANCRVENLASYVDSDTGAARRRTVEQIMQRTEFQQRYDRATEARQAAMRQSVVEE